MHTLSNRSELAEEINSMLISVDKLKAHLKTRDSRITDRLLVIEDQLVLMSLELRLPLQPVG